MNAATEPALTLRRQVWFTRNCQQKSEAESANENSSRIPCIARLLALAIRYDQLLQAGHVGDYQELSQLGQVSRARITQIMNLCLLAPDIQEAILFWETGKSGNGPISERDLRPIVAHTSWSRQRVMWARLMHKRSLSDHHGLLLDNAKVPVKK